MMEAGGRPAEKVLGLDIELVIAGLVQHAAAFDVAAVSPYTRWTATRCRVVR